MNRFNQSTLRSTSFGLLKFIVVFSLSMLAAGCGGGGNSGSGATSPTNGGPVPNTISGTVMFKGTPMPGVTDAAGAIADIAIAIAETS